MEDLGYEEIKHLDKHRGVLLGINASEGTWRLLKMISSSVMPSVLFSWDFFISFIIYVAARFLARYEYLAAVNLASFRGLHTLGVLLAFMVSFYVNTCISRFFLTASEAMCLVARINNMALLLRGFLWASDEEQAMSRRIMDYMLAAQCLGYVGLNAGYDMENVFYPFNEEYGLLTPLELKMVESHRTKSTSRYRECLAWAVQELFQAQAKGLIAPPVMSGMQGRVMDFQNAMQELHDLKHQPIPFVSEHLLVLFLWIYLPIQTFEMAIQAEVLLRTGGKEPIFFRHSPATWFMVEIFSALLALLANFGFRGLFQVGAFIEDPYGSDLTDMRVLHFCMLATRESRAVLAAGSPRKSIPPKQESTREISELTEQLERHGQLVPEGLQVHGGLRCLRSRAEQAQAEHEKSMQAAGAKVSGDPAHMLDAYDTNTEAPTLEKELTVLDREGTTASGLIQVESTIEREGSTGNGVPQAPEIKSSMPPGLVIQDHVDSI